MEDLSLRAAFHRALDPVAPPAPWFAEAVKRDLRARRDAYRAAHSRRRGRFALALPDEFSRLAAVALILIVIMASLAAFIGVNLFIHQAVPVQFPHAVSRACASSDYTVTSDGAQWQPSAEMRSTDGGVTWRSVAPPHVQGYLGGGDSVCVVDGQHAWSVEEESAPLPTCGEVTACQSVVVLSTADAGATWRPGGSVAVPSTAVSTLLDFADDQHGWLLTDTGVATIPEQQRSLYATADGGLHWKRLATANLADGSPLGKTGFGCGVTGMVMTPTDDGWITWDCASRGTLTGTPPVIATHDGGRTWTAVQLPAIPDPVISNCGAQPPVFSGQNGAMPFFCNAGATGFNGVFRTADRGRTWTVGALPVTTRNVTVNFVDGSVGFAVAPRAGNPPTSGSTIYSTADGGKTWRVVAAGLFPGVNGGLFSFLDARRGYATVGGHVWRTLDGGLTWVVLPPYHSVGTTVCTLAPAPTAANAELSAPRMFGTSGGWDAGARHTSDGGAHWATSLPALPSLATAGNGEYFLDANDAWIVQAVGSSAACADHVFVYRTTDGGQSWAKAASISVPPKTPTTDWTPSIYFLDRSRGWMFASTGVLYRTVDGGATWSAVSATAGASAAGCTVGPEIAFASPTDGWLGLHCFDNSSQTNNPAPYRLLVTRNGGATWSVQTIAPNLLTYDSLTPTFFDARHGYIWDPGYGMLAMTSDGGRTWSVRTLPISGYPCIGKGGTSGFCSNDVVFGMSFLNASNGWGLIGTIAFPPGGKGSGPITVAYRFVRTTNGGLSWTVYSRLPTTTSPDGNGTSSLQFITASDAFWMAGTRWLVSHDGGRTWRLVFTGVAPQ